MRPAQRKGCWVRCCTEPQMPYDISKLGRARKSYFLTILQKMLLSLTPRPSQEAPVLRNQLKTHLGKNHPILTFCTLRLSVNKHQSSSGKV